MEKRLDLWYNIRDNTEEFKEKRKRRAIIEPKNAEMKRFHGLARAEGYGLVVKK